MEIPIQTLPLFPVLDRKLIQLLKSLQPSDWAQPTRARQWTVKDIAAHLLDGNLRTLSMVRDQFFGDPPGAFHSYQQLLDYLNRLNADWVAAAKRLSPQVLINLLEWSGESYFEVLRSLKPFDRAIFAVDWAGEKESQNWFHIAREYTEKWHHQQQIREAVNKPGIMTRELYYPVMETFMRALPHTYRNVKAEESVSIRITVSGDLGGQWILMRKNSQWMLAGSQRVSPAAEVELDPVTAWQLFTKGLGKEEASQKVLVRGEKQLAEPVMEMVAVMA